MMRKRIVALCMGMTLFAGNVVYAQKLDLENQFTRPLSDVMNDLSRRFDVKFKYNVDTIGKRLPYADFRIRPYSVEETLTMAAWGIPSSPADRGALKRPSERTRSGCTCCQ